MHILSSMILNWEINYDTVHTLPAYTPRHMHIPTSLCFLGGRHALVDKEKERVGGERATDGDMYVHELRVCTCRYIRADIYVYILCLSACTVYGEDGNEEQIILFAPFLGPISNDKTAKKKQNVAFSLLLLRASRITLLAVHFSSFSCFPEVAFSFCPSRSLPPRVLSSLPSCLLRTTRSRTTFEQKEDAFPFFAGLRRSERDR